MLSNIDTMVINQAIFDTAVIIALTKKCYHCYIIDNKRLILDWKLLSATVTIRVSCPQQDSDGRLQK